MTIEATLERIAAALERQAAALEAPMAAIRGAQAAAADVPAKRGPGRPAKTEAAPPVEAPVAAAPVTPAAPAPEADLDPPGDSGNFLDDEPAADAPAYQVDDVRKALIKYGQKPGCSQEKARALLKQHGHVDTLKALKPERFKAVIDAAG